MSRKIFALLLTFILVFAVGQVSGVTETIENAGYPQQNQIVPEQMPTDTEVEIEVSSSSLFFGKHNCPANVYNAKVAVAALNGIIIQPGEIFSFNQTLGPRTWDKGYRWGYGVKNERLFAGGICRISTLICQAAQNGGFEIVERHSHSKRVDYAKPGRDATVYYGKLDFRFKNNSEYPIKLYTSSWDDDKGTTLQAKIVRIQTIIQ